MPSVCSTLTSSAFSLVCVNSRLTSSALPLASALTRFEGCNDSRKDSSGGVRGAAALFAAVGCSERRGPRDEELGSALLVKSYW